jgi:hypothetical protein
MCRFWVVSCHSLVVALYPPCPFPRCAPCRRYRHSTCNPPHEQLLVGLEAGGALLSVVCHSFVIVCCRSVVVVCHRLFVIVCRHLVVIVCCHLFVIVCHHLFVVICHRLFIIVCRHLFIVVCRLSYIIHSLSSFVIDWHPSSLPIHPASSGSQRQGVGADM